MTQFTFYPTLNNTSQHKFIQSQNWLESIRNPGENYLNSILLARQIAARGKGSDTYNSIKRTKLPCILTNVLATGGRKKENILCPTGLIYIDYDFKTVQEAVEKKQELINNPFTYSCWYSLSGTGVGSLVKINSFEVGKPAAEFKQAYKLMCDTLGLIDWDTHAATETRVVVLSYDSEIYINDLSSLYEWSLEPSIQTERTEDRSIVVGTEAQQTPASISNSDLSKNVAPCNSQEIRIMDGATFFPRLRTQIELVDYPDSLVFIPEGKLYFKCYLPFIPVTGKVRKLTEGERWTILSSYAHHLVILNPQAERDQFLQHMLMINRNHCVIPLANREIIILVESKLKNRDSLKPNPKFVTYKKYWIDPAAPNKKQIYIDFLKCNSIEAKLEQFVADELWSGDEKVKTVKLAKQFDISRASIDKVYNKRPDLKLAINEFNNSIRKQKTHKLI